MASRAGIEALIRGDSAPRCKGCGRSWTSESDGWVRLGIAPRPATVWQNFWHHVAHGMLMRFPMRRVLPWSWSHRRSFL